MKKFFKQNKIWIVMCISFLIILCLAFGIILYFSPSIRLNGKKKITVNIHNKYHEYGAKATYQGQDISDDIVIEGKVDTDTKGTYEVNYIIKKGLFGREIKREVEVKDIEKPKITLNGEKEVYYCPGQDFEYEEEGFTATDNVDGDITKNVSIVKEKDKIIYEVKDKEGNEEKVERKLLEQDKQSPTITLLGGEVLTVLQNTTFKDSYEAKDNCNGDITDKVKISGTVDTKTTGNYELTYEVSDDSGNTATAKRTVTVIPPDKGGVIYLTFDDGPKEGTTNVILDVLKEEGVKATFFVTNGGPDSLIKREYDEGHTVALHTASHNYQTVYSSVDAYFNDLQSVHDRVYRITGYDSKIIRFPGGSSNTISRNYSVGIMSKLTKEVVNRGYHYFDWNVSSGDAGDTTSADGVYNNVVNGLSKKRANVILMHDIKPYTRDALRRIIQYGKTHGYTFSAITYETPMVKHGVNN